MNSPENTTITKEELTNTVKQWIDYDTDINKLNKQISDLKRQVQTKSKDKKKLTDKLILVIKRNNADISLGTQTLVHKVSKTKKPITKKYLLEQINLYFKSQPEVASDVSKQILDNREVNGHTYL